MSTKLTMPLLKMIYTIHYDKKNYLTNENIPDYGYKETAIYKKSKEIRKKKRNNDIIIKREEV